jgi:hypothetical protein
MRQDGRPANQGVQGQRPRAADTLPGCETKRSWLTIRDKLRYRVVWDDRGVPKTLTDALTAGPVALRFHVRRGALYAFQILE